MARKKHVEHENHERWLVSYADFITLLFAFFVVMFASSQTDKSKAKQVSEAVEKALKEGSSVSIPPAVAKVLGGTVDDKGQGNAQMHGPGGAQDGHRGLGRGQSHPAAGRAAPGEQRRVSDAARARPLVRRPGAHAPLPHAPTGVGRGARP